MKNRLQFWVRFAIVGFMPWITSGQVQINFSNGTVGVNAPVLGPDGVTLLEGPEWKVQLWYKNLDGVLVPVESSVTELGTGASAGYFWGGTVVIPDIPHGATLTCQVRVWDSTTGATWEEATLSSESSCFNVELTNEPANLVGMELAFFLVGSDYRCLPDCSAPAAPILSPSGENKIAVTVKTINGCSYSLQKATTLNPPNWSEVDSFDANGIPVSRTFPMDDVQTYFRTVSSAP